MPAPDRKRDPTIRREGASTPAASVKLHDHFRRARLAIDIFCLRIKKYLGADLDFLGITVDPGKNEELTAGREGEIGADGARVRLYVIPTNEELLIARDTIRCILDAPRRW